MHDDLQTTKASELNTTIDNHQQSRDALRTAHESLTEIEQYLFDDYTGEEGDKRCPEEGGKLSEVAGGSEEILQSAATLQTRLNTFMNRLGVVKNKVHPIASPEKTRDAY